MTMLKNMGWKTLLAVALMVLVAVAEGVLGIDVPAVNVADNWGTVLIEALGLGGIRAAIAKNILGSLVK
jgi:hypothetical protein